MTGGLDVIVVGAGIVGAACARECALAGLRTAIVEGQAPGGAATAAGMGHVVVMDDSPAQLTLSKYGRELWRQLRPGLPANVEYERPGTLWVAADAEEMAEVYAKCKTYAQVGVAAEVLDEHGVASAEPNLRKGLAGGLLVLDDAVVYPPAAVGSFLREALEHGVQLIRGSRVLSAGAGEVRLEDGRAFSTAKIVIATGTDTSLVPWVTVRPRKGHLAITDRYPGFIRHQIVELGYLKSAHSVHADSVAFNLQPRQTGQLLIGSSRQYGDTGSAIDSAIVRRMLDRACEYMPGLRGLSVLRLWTGFRASTPDKLPLIGPTADPTVDLLMGFEGLGITNALSAARLALAHLLVQAAEIDPTPFLPERLARQEALVG